MTTQSPDPDQTPIEVIINTTLRQALTIDRPVDTTSSESSDEYIDPKDVTTEYVDADLSQDTTMEMVDTSDETNIQLDTSSAISESKSNIQKSAVASTQRHLAVAGALIRSISQTTDSIFPEFSARNNTPENENIADSLSSGTEMNSEKTTMTHMKDGLDMNTDQTITTTSESLLSALLMSMVAAYALDSPMNHSADPWRPSSLDFRGMFCSFSSNQSLLIITGAVAACQRFDVEARTVATRAQIPYETLIEYLQRSQ